jgi:hypothetical protein
MLIKTKDNTEVYLRKLVSDDFDNLVYYLVSARKRCNSLPSRVAA